MRRRQSPKKCIRSSYRYDRAGRLTERKEELDSGLAPVKGEPGHGVTRYCYDENGNRTEIVTPEGYRILRTYDACYCLASERITDDQNGIDRTTSVIYDYAGNITKLVCRGKGQEAWELSYGYDLKDRITHVKDCMGPVFSYEYDKNDLLKEEVLPQTEEKAEYENRNQYVYDSYGRLLTQTDGAGTIRQEHQYLPDQKRTWIFVERMKHIKMLLTRLLKGLEFLKKILKSFNGERIYMEKVFQ